MTELVRQREDWDCAVACVAMALGLAYPEVLPEFGPRKGMGYYGGEICAAVKALGGQATVEPFNYAGSLCRHIVQVSLVRTRAAHHWIWVDEAGAFWCPAVTVKQWGQIFGFGQMVSIGEPDFRDVPF